MIGDRHYNKLRKNKQNTQLNKVTFYGLSQLSVEKLSRVSGGPGTTGGAGSGGGGYLSL